MTETTGATCPTCSTGLPAAGTPCPRCHPPTAWSPGPYPAGQYAGPPPQHPSFPPLPAQPAGYGQAPYGSPYAPMVPAPHPPRAQKSVGVAVLLTFLWLGAGHLYLDRAGAGVTLMAAHFVLGILLLAIFAPLGFLVWLVAFIASAITCSNLAAAINAGTAPPTATW